VLGALSSLIVDTHNARALCWSYFFCFYQCIMASTELCSVEKSLNFAQESHMIISLEKGGDGMYGKATHE
jgi:hypothetical protein